MDSSPGFGSNPSDIGALFGLAFASAPGMNPLATPLRVKSLAHYAKGTLSPSYEGSKFFVRITFQVLFHPPSGVLFTFPSRY